MLRTFAYGVPKIPDAVPGNDVDVFKLLLYNKIERVFPVGNTLSLRSKISLVI
jgi:hypothetical protein